jgi:Alpha/beta hydrolase
VQLVGDVVPGAVVAVITHVAALAGEFDRTVFGRSAALADDRHDAINLYSQSLKADPNDPTAVIAWMGYDAPEFDFQHPESALADPTKLQQVGSPWMAREGGALLAGDVNGLAVTYDDSIPLHVTVIGHSYGSTTVADAFANSGMHANEPLLRVWGE